MRDTVQTHTAVQTDRQGRQATMSYLMYTALLCRYILCRSGFVGTNYLASYRGFVWTDGLFE